MTPAERMLRAIRYAAIDRSFIADVFSSVVEEAAKCSYCGGTGDCSCPSPKLAEIEPSKPGPPSPTMKAWENIERRKRAAKGKRRAR